MAVLLALLVIAGDAWPSILSFQTLTFGAEPRFWLSLLAYPLVIYLLVLVPMKRMREGGLPATEVGE